MVINPLLLSGIVLGLLVLVFVCAYWACALALDNYHHESLLPAMRVLAGSHAPDVVPPPIIQIEESRKPVPPRPVLKDVELEKMMQKLHGSA